MTSLSQRVCRSFRPVQTWRMRLQVSHQHLQMSLESANVCMHISTTCCQHAVGSTVPKPTNAPSGLLTLPKIQRQLPVPTPAPQFYSGCQFKCAYSILMNCRGKSGFSPPVKLCPIETHLGELRSPPRVVPSFALARCARVAGTWPAGCCACRVGTVKD